MNALTILYNEEFVTVKKSQDTIVVIIFFDRECLLDGLTIDYNLNAVPLVKSIQTGPRIYLHEDSLISRIAEFDSDHLLPPHSTFTDA